MEVERGERESRNENIQRELGQVVVVYRWLFQRSQRWKASKTRVLPYNSAIETERELHGKMKTFVLSEMRTRDRKQYDLDRSLYFFRKLHSIVVNTRELYRRLPHSFLSSRTMKKTSNYVKTSRSYRSTRKRFRCRSSVIRAFPSPEVRRMGDGRWWMGSNGDGKSVAEGRREGRDGSKGDTAACGLLRVSKGT